MPAAFFYLKNFCFSNDPSLPLPHRFLKGKICLQQIPQYYPETSPTTSDLSLRGETTKQSHEYWPSLRGGTTKQSHEQIAVFRMMGLPQRLELQ